jgi:hypothetical protein
MRGQTSRQDATAKEVVQLVGHEAGQRPAVGLVGPLLLEGQQVLLDYLEKRCLLGFPLAGCLTSSVLDRAPRDPGYRLRRSRRHNKAIPSKEKGNPGVPAAVWPRLQLQPWRRGWVVLAASGGREAPLPSGLAASGRISPPSGLMLELPLERVLPGRVRNRGVAHSAELSGPAWTGRRGLTPQSG